MRRKQLEFELLYLHLHLFLQSYLRFLRHSQKEEIVLESIIYLLYQYLCELHIIVLYIYLSYRYIQTIQRVLSIEIYFSLLDNVYMIVKGR